MSSAFRRVAALVERLAEIAPEARDAPESVRVVRAPGRVNLLGEHTDYNLGFVMPVAISMETWIASWPSPDETVRLLSLQEGSGREFEVGSPGPPRGEWSDYFAGVAWSLAGERVPLRAVSAVVDSEIPIGAGLSSSAALEVSAAWTLSVDVPPRLSRMDLARAAQRAENEYVGVKSGLMDQFASCFGRHAAAVLLDCRSLEHRLIPMPDRHTLVAIDTRSPHTLSASEYNARREQCERGVAAIAQRYPLVESLRDVTFGMLDETDADLDDETLRRCRHVVAENERVLHAKDALENGDLAALDSLFAESHASLRDLYEVSSPELDALVEIATSVDGVVGARMTGAGFGGCTVNLVRDDAVDPLREAVESEYPRRAGRQAGFYVLHAVDGAGLVPGS